MNDETSLGVAKPTVRVATRERDQSQRDEREVPRYHVILWDDDDHTYDYVIRMMQELFAHNSQQGYAIASLVDRMGRAICLTTTLEHAELKRDQIHAYGKDDLIRACQGSMTATIEASP